MIYELAAQPHVIVSGSRGCSLPTQFVALADDHTRGAITLAGHVNWCGQLGEQTAWNACFYLDGTIPADLECVFYYGNSEGSWVELGKLASKVPSLIVPLPRDAVDCGFKFFMWRPDILRADQTRQIAELIAGAKPIGSQTAGPHQSLEQLSDALETLYNGVEEGLQAIKNTCTDNEALLNTLMADKTGWRHMVTD
jgi:hypothetical protein